MSKMGIWHGSIGEAITSSCEWRVEEEYIKDVIITIIAVDTQ